MICWRCGQPYLKKAHGTPDDCIRALQQRNHRDRQQITENTTALGDLAHEVSRLSQRVEMLCVQLQARNGADHSGSAETSKFELSYRFKSDSAEDRGTL